MPLVTIAPVDCGNPLIVIHSAGPFGEDYKRADAELTFWPPAGLVQTRDTALAWERKHASGSCFRDKSP